MILSDVLSHLFPVVHADSSVPGPEKPEAEKTAETTEPASETQDSETTADTRETEESATEEEEPEPEDVAFLRVHVNIASLI